MTPKNFILNKIENLISQFPQLMIRYEHDESCDSHFIEVSPITEFESNQIYISVEREISIEFVNLFPFDILTFVSEEDGLVLESPMIFKTKTQNRILRSKLKKFNFEHIISDLFEDYDVDWKKKINFTTTNIGSNSNYSNIFESLTAKKSNTNISNLERVQNPEVYTSSEALLPSEEIDYDCDTTTNDYPLAA